MKTSFVIFLFAISLISCTSQDDAIATGVAQTVIFENIVDQAVSTGIAATLTAFPTSTATDTPQPTSTFTPTATNTATATPTDEPPTATILPTDTLVPTETLPPEPTETTTPTAAELKVIRLYTAARNLKRYAENIYSGLGGSGTGGISCSRELSDSIVANYDRIAGLEVFDDSMFSDRLVGANINYNVGRKAILEDANIKGAYDHCATWLEAGKPDDFDWEWPDLNAAMAKATQAAKSAEAALNN